MLTIVVAIPLVLFPPVFDSVQSSCGFEPMTATSAELPTVDGFTRRTDAYMEIHNDVERRLAAQWATAFAEHPTAGHDLPLDDGAWVARQVGDWLRTLAGRR